MKTSKIYLFLFWTILSVCITNPLSGNSIDGYDINAISKEFIEKFVVNPLAQSQSSYSSVLTGSGCSITITKAGTFNDQNNDGFAQAGETITYTFTVCNDGSEDLFNVTVNDPLSPVGGAIPFLPAMTGSGMPMTGSTSCDATTFSTVYTIMGSDIQSGQVSNTGFVNAFDAAGNPISGTSNTVITPLTEAPDPIENPGISITKSSVLNDSNNDGFAQVGETITYSFTVCNTGDVRLNNISVTDILVPVSGSISLNASAAGVNCNTTAFSAVYTLDQQDLDNGEVVNVANVSGTTPQGVTVVDQSNVDVTPLNIETVVINSPSIDITKTGFFNDENSDGFAQVGETILYTFRVCNDGDADVFNITIDDLIVDVPGSISSLPVATGSGVSCNFSLSAVYSITQNDIDNGQVVNIATANGVDGENESVSDQSNASIVMLNGEDPGVGDNPSISLTKSGVFNDENNDGFGQVGETITYSFVVCNTGDTQVNGISIFDPIAPVSASIASLSPSGTSGSCSVVLTSSYTLGQNDISSGQVTNIATATGTTPNGIQVADNSDDPNNGNNFDANGDGEPDDPTITTFNTDSGTSTAAISIEKIGTFNDANNDGYAQAGETITYTFTVCNDGPEDVTNITVMDPLVSVSGGPIEMLAGTGSGIACDMTSFTAEYTLLPSDIANGQVTNVATVQGFDRNGNTVSDFSDDPFNPFNFDQNGDNNPDDPTVTNLNIEPVELLASLGNYVWEDIDGDGIQDLNEPGIEGVRVELYNNNGVIDGITYTDSAGFYLFEGLEPGQYYVRFYEPSGYSFTSSNVGDNNLVDSNVNDSNGVGTTSTVTLSPGEVDLTIDAGLYECVPLGELVWYDTNQNSVWDDIENGLNGIKVHVYRFDGNSYELYDVQFTGHKPGTPSDDGYWKMCVPPGMYYVEYIIPPFGLVTALPNAGNDAIDSDVTDANGPGTTSIITLRSGDSKCDLGAGYYPQATLGDRVWYDSNRNGQQEASEPGAGGITVKVYNRQGLEVNNLVTEADGTYIADYLKDDEYYIEIQPPNGYAATTANATSDDKDSDVDHSHGINTTPTFKASPGQHTPNVDAGLISSFILSIDWLSVTADRNNDQNTVYWSVTSDADVVDYSVERKLGQSSVFQSIGQIVSTQSAEKADYSLTDTQSTAVGQYYYRVKMTMIDGTVNYSEITYLQVRDSAEIENLASIYPNPAVNNVTLTVSVLSRGSDVSVSIYNDLGQSIFTDRLLESDADFGTHRYNLDVADYPRGRYIVEVKVGDDRVINKMVLVE